MKRKLFLGGVIAAFLALASTLNAPANAQIGIGRTASDLTLDGQLSLAAGDVNDPSLIFTDDDDGTGTGMYRGAADSIYFTSNGTNSLQILVNTLRARNGAATVPSFSFIAEGDIGMFRVGADNVGFSSGGVLVFDIENTNVAGGSANLATISSTLGIMDGAGDIVNALSVEITNVDHTGGNVNAISIATMTGDANAQENLFFLGDGFDFVFDLTEALGTHTATTNSDKDANAASGTLKVEVNGTLYHIQLYADS